MLACRRDSRVASLRAPRRGQAVIELIPSFFIFALVFSAASALFEIMRNATLVQEAARNMAFAKIGNSGTLTTPPDGVGALVIGREPAAEISNVNPYIGSGNSCFSVFPTQPSHSVEALPIWGVETAIRVAFFTKASVYRQPGGACRRP